MICPVYLHGFLPIDMYCSQTQVVVFGEREKIEVFINVPDMKPCPSIHSIRESIDI